MSQTASALGEFVPRKETGALEFLSKHPDYDGRGVVIAILDSGVDVSSPLLRTTSTGAPKVIEQVDASGSGDIDTRSTVTTAKGAKLIKGASGRTLTLNEQWTNPTGVWHVGSRMLSDLVPFQDPSSDRIADREKKLATKETAALSARVREQGGPDMEKKLECLSLLETSFGSPGAVVDVVVWHDGNVWRAVLSTSSDLQACVPMTDYRTEKQFAFIDDVDLISYTVNIYDSGNLLSVHMSGSHGTHVASIAAGYCPTDPRLNGVAPGAQIVSIRIGHGALGTMEVHEGLERAISVCVANKVDLISLSYGEQEFSRFGRFSDLLARMVRDYGIVYVTSAGNDGPCYHTSAQPSPSFGPFFRVGAILTPDLSENAYFMPPPGSPVMPFSFTSRGPDLLSGLNANVCAPGGALAAVPKWTHSLAGLKNGTSMAAPNLSGSLALIFSGLRAQKIPWTPASIQCAVEATCTMAPFRGYSWADVGFGMIQVGPAFEFACQHPAVAGEPSSIVVAASSDGKQGVCLRDCSLDTSREESFSLKVVWPEETPAETKASFMMQLQFRSSVPWVETPAVCTIFNEGNRPIVVKVDPRKIPVAGASFGYVIGYPPGKPECGVVRIPVAVFKPTAAHPQERKVTVDDLVLEQGTPPFRQLLTPPTGATHATFTLRTKDNGGGSPKIVFSVNQLYPGKRCSETPLGSIFQIVDTNQVIQRACECAAGHTMEVVLMEHHSSPGRVTLSVEVQFFSYTMQGRWGGGIGTRLVSDAVGLIAIKNEFSCAQKASFSASLKKMQHSIRASSTEITGVLPPRYTNIGSVLPLQQMVLNYEFKIPGDAAQTVSLYSQLDELTYGYSHQSLLYLFTAQKEFVHAWGWGGFNHASSSYGTVSLRPGSYVAKLFVRHESLSSLESLKGLVLTMELPLSKTISLSLKSSLMDAVGGANGAGKVNTSVMAGESTTELWVAPLSDLPPGVAAGDVLIGELQVGGASPATMSYPISVCIQSVTGAASRPAAGESSAASSSNRSVEEVLMDAQISAAISVFAARKDPLSNWHPLASQQIAAYPNHSGQLALDLRMVCLRAAARDGEHALTLKLADEILGHIPQAEVALHFGMNCSDANLRKQFQAKKDVLIETLKIKVTALKATGGDHGSAYQTLVQWADPASVAQMDLKGPVLLLHHLTQLKKTGIPNSRDTFDKCQALLQELEWPYWIDAFQLHSAKCFPQRIAFPFDKSK